MKPKTKMKRRKNNRRGKIMLELNHMVEKEKWDHALASLVMIDLVVWYSLCALGQSSAMEWISLAVNEAMESAVRARKIRGMPVH